MIFLVRRVILNIFLTKLKAYWNFFIRAVGWLYNTGTI